MYMKSKARAAKAWIEEEVWAAQHLVEEALSGKISHESLRIFSVSLPWISKIGPPALLGHKCPSCAGAALSTS